MTTTTYTRKKQGYWTKERIIKCVHVWKRRYKKLPTAREWNNIGTNPEHPSIKTIWHAFGTWNKMIEAAGYKPRTAGGSGFKMNFTKAKTKPTTTATTTKSKTTTTTKGKKNGHRIWTREEIIDVIQMWTREHGTAPTLSDFNGKSPFYPNHAPITRIFGSWNKAVEAAGVPTLPEHINKYQLARFKPLPRRTKTKKEAR
jgi:hypothetical protein